MKFYEMIHFFKKLKLPGVTDNKGIESLLSPGSPLGSGRAKTCQHLGSIRRRNHNPIF